jgi:hypothetical protein
MMRDVNRILWFLLGIAIAFAFLVPPGSTNDEKPDIPYTDIYTRAKQKAMHGIQLSVVNTGVAVVIHWDTEHFSRKGNTVFYRVEYTLADGEHQRRLRAYCRYTRHKSGRTSTAIEYLPIDEEPHIHLQVVPPKEE